jgi:hypothetical protein
MNNNAMTSPKTLQQAYRFDPKTVGSSSRFMMRFILSSVTITAVLVGIFFGAPYAQRWLQKRKAAPTQADVYVEQVQKAKANKPKFDPPQTENYKNSYVDNVLFTKGFVKSEQNADYQDKYILQVNKYFVRELDMTEADVVEFIPLEKKLIRQLADIKKSIDPDDESEGIAKMRQLEEDALRDMQELLGGDKKWQKFQKFKAKFFAENRIGSADND